MIALVGYTGFVGSNIYSRARNRINGVFNTQNIEKAYGLEPEVLIYAGLTAEKHLANTDPYKDMELVLQAQHNIKMINPQKLVLISTVDVYRNPVGVDETVHPLADTEYAVHPYGLNRYYLEAWVRKNYPDALIMRLPGLYGLNIRKNFIYDCMNVIPSELKKEKFEELAALEKAGDAIMLRDCYRELGNGIYQCAELEADKKELLRAKFEKLGYTAFSFTDSRSVFQFYPLRRLWEDIHTALDYDITLLNIATEPVSAGELYKALTGQTFKNELEGKPAKYDFRTVHAEKFGGKDGYICSKEETVADVRQFVENNALEKGRR